MSTTAQRFKRQFKSELTMIRTDRIGNLILLSGFIFCVMWALFMAYLILIYKPKDAVPSPRIAGSGLAQIGFYALMIWVVMALLGAKARGFWNMRVLVEPSRAIITVTTLTYLTIGTVLFSLASILVSLPLGYVVVKLANGDPTPLIGSPGDIGIMLVQLIGFALGATWFAVGCALICNKVGTAIASVVLWPLLIEGMLPEDGLLSVIHEFMPFTNGLAWYEGNPALHLYWPAPVGLLYFLLLTLAFALVGVWLRRRETLVLEQ